MIERRSRFSTLALIVPYYGTLPNYYQLWLDSCADNSWVDFYVPSDCDFSAYRVPRNVHIVDMGLSEIRSRLAGILGFQPVLDPYKLCDCRPLYGLVFPELVEGHEWWGYCDCDLIFGRLNNFLSVPLSGDYDRVYRHGHLMIFRNRGEVKSVALTRLRGVRASWRDVYRHRCSAHYDECPFFEALLEQAGMATFVEVTFADLDRFALPFRMRELDGSYPEIDHFEKRTSGELLAHLTRGGVRELSYVHFQWRAMAFSEGFDPAGGYLVYPNVFTNAPAPSQPQVECERYAKRMHEKHRERQLQNILHGNLVLRLKGYTKERF